MVLLSLDFSSSEQIASHFSKWNRSLKQRPIQAWCILLHFPNRRHFSVCLASYHLQIMFFSLFASFFLISFLAPCKRYSRHEDNSWTMQQIFGRSSLFHLLVTKILSLSLRNCRLNALFSLRTTWESKGLDTRNLFLPQGGQIH